MTTTRIRPCGEAALLLDCADLAEAVALAEEIGRARTGAVDVVAAARTVLVTAGGPSELPRLRRALEALLAQRDPGGRTPRSEPSRAPGQPRDPLPSDPIRYPDTGSESAGRVADSGDVVTLDVRYDGPDLADVAELAGISTEELVRRHTSITWKAAFGGFAPGFFYLVDARELDADAAPEGRAAGGGSLPTVPRLGSPRPKVPAGSVAVADRFCAVYPGASPGGWRLLGTTDAALWDVDRPQPALLAPGTLVRFREHDGGSARGSSDGGRGRELDRDRDRDSDSGRELDRDSGSGATG